MYDTEEKTSYSYHWYSAQSSAASWTHLPERKAAIIAVYKFKTYWKLKD